ncbi:hypothetical protein HTSR_1863 [Halodesulfurarchaeum formicicum]|uniref:Uncharacterized protein n=1 Tax=Halodesulfurarchaeum formicicum TaxID=1873524 RepID=A0A1D8S6R9_9EURY|nr:hypothetical protein [Halodesulfurarchaeum formicicum]AOW81028.1 hypothetical protein HTSR_1863 [Halodesulfurarchaeum formicicum]
MDTRRIILVAVLLLALLAALFAFADFRVLESETTADSSVGTSQLGDAAAPVERPVQLVVLGENPHASMLRGDLAVELSATFQSIEQAPEPTADWNGSILVVDLRERSVQYNPVAPSGRVTANFAFVGSGNVTLATGLATEESTLIVTNADPYVVHGEVTVSDRSRGLVSRPAYRAHLQGALAEELATALGRAPGMP